MKLVLMLVIRDEEDIIKANLDYHLAAGVDFVMIADHQCLDRTMDIVRDYERQGYASVQSKPEPGYYQGRWLTQMAKDAFERHAADWIIPGDADEFWWVENDGTLKQALEQVPASVPAVGARRHNFVARSGQNGAGFLSSMTFREVSSLNALGDKLPGKVCFRARSDIIVRQGSHDLIVGGEVVKPAAAANLKVFHFPIRTKEQFVAKVKVHGEAYLQTDLPGVGGAKRKLYDLYRDDGLEAYLSDKVLSDDDLAVAIAKGEAVEDTRLRDFFATRGLRQPAMETMAQSGSSLDGPLHSGE
jgi:Glycosyl transferase family 2